MMDRVPHTPSFVSKVDVVISLPSHTSFFLSFSVFHSLCTSTASALPRSRAPSLLTSWTPWSCSRPQGPFRCLPPQLMLEAHVSPLSYPTLQSSRLLMTMASGRYGESVDARSDSVMLTALEGCVRHHDHCFYRFHRHGLACATREYCSFPVIQFVLTIPSPNASIISSLR